MAAISERKAAQAPVIVRLAQSHVPLSRAVLRQNFTGATFRNGQPKVSTGLMGSLSTLRDTSGSQQARVTKSWY
jgi:hypothetical protein